MQLAIGRSFFEFLDSAPVYVTFIITWVPMILHLILHISTVCEWKIAMIFTQAVRTGIRKFLIFLLPQLFSEKKVLLANNTAPTVLHFMNHPLHNDGVHNKLNCITFWLFGALGLNVLFMTVIAFFRYFPIEKSSECKDFDSSFRTLYCFTNTSDLPVNCTNIDDATDVICYAFLLDLPVAAGASYGLIKFAAFIITLGVFAAKCWVNNATRLGNYSPRHCKTLFHRCTTECCCTMWFVGLFVSALIAAGIILAVILISALEVKASRVPQSVGEVYYDAAYLFILAMVLPAFFLCIPCLVVCHKDRPTCDYIAMQDSPASASNGQTPEES